VGASAAFHGHDIGQQLIFGFKMSMFLFVFVVKCKF